MGAEFGLDEPADLFLDGVEGEGRWGWGPRIPSPGEPILPVEAVFPTGGLCALHENACLPPDISVEGVHPPWWPLPGSGPEFVMGGEPTLMRNELQSASIHEGLQIGTQFPFRRRHHSHGS